MTQAPCRHCGAPLEEVFVDLGMSPIANDNIPADRESAMEPFYPLTAMVCGECFLVQLLDYEAAENMFDEDYAYFSSYSTSWLEHARLYVEEMTGRLGLDSGSKVVELASNDGYLLQYFQEREIPVLGVEPTASTAAVAREKGITTVEEFFGVEVARRLAGEGQADLLLGNNVLAHVPDINDFVGGMKILLKPGGVITMEFQNRATLIELNQWDTIYHEHFSYLCFSSAARIFERHGMRLFDVEELPTHGGSLRIYACHEEDAGKPQTEAARRMLEREDAAGLNDLSTYRSFARRVEEDKRQIVAFMIGLKEQGLSIAGYGAPAKGNTLLNYCGIGRDFLQYTCDMNPHKQGHVLPGTHIPIVDPARIDETRPDVVLILPWNLRDEVMEQLAQIREWGGVFAARAPELRLFE
ncbi:MAG: methyltransferase domain-containing protein [Solirubrobacterales bacterium]